MANPLRGEVSLPVDGETYTLRLATNELVELEDHLGQTVNEIVAQLSDPSRVKVKVLRATLWAALKARHPDISLEQAGEIMNALGLGQTLIKVIESFSAAFPAPDQTKKPSARPPKAVGTGSRS